MRKSSIVGLAAPLSLLAVLLLLAVAMAPDYYPAGVRTTINKWRPRVELQNRTEEFATDTAGTTTNWVMVGGPAPLATMTTTYADNDKILHPDWVYIPEGFGGHKWWAVASPFPKDTEVNPSFWENPEIFYRDDGLTWTAIAGNPIDAAPTGLKNNADPSLLYDNAVLYCYYGEGDVDAEPDAHYIRYRTSTDGETWSSEGTVLTGLLNTLAAPVVRNVRGTYYLWTVDVAATPDVAQVRTGSSPVGPWSAATTCTLTGAASTPWHVNYTVIGDKIVMLGTIGAERYGQIGVSTDGVTFLFDKNLKYTGPAGAWDDIVTYQFGQPIWNPQGQFFDLIYGGLDVDDADDDYRIGNGRLYSTRAGVYPEKRAALNRILATLGDCRGFWPVLEQSGTSVLDASMYSALSAGDHDLTASENIGVWDTPPARSGGVYNVITYNGTDEYFTTADDDHLSFGGTAIGSDVAFSAGGWINVVAGSLTREMFCKGDNGTTDTREYRIYLLDTEKPIVYLYDESVDANISSVTDAALSAGWHYVVVTYDGSETEGGLEWYVDGVLAPNTDALTGVYVAMENQADPLYVGALNYDDAARTDFYWSSGAAGWFITAKQLSAAENWTLYQDAKIMYGR